MNHNDVAAQIAKALQGAPAGTALIASVIVAKPGEWRVLIRFAPTSRLEKPAAIKEVIDANTVTNTP